MNPKRFAQLTGRLPQRSAPFTVPIKTAPKPLDPAGMYHYWYPGREGVEPCPKAFREELTRFHPDLAICKPPPGAPTASRPWLVWYRKPDVTYWLSPGWMLLFVWQTQDLTPLPLDNRIYANLYKCSARVFGGGLDYFKSVVATLQADKDREAKAQRDYRQDRGRDYFEFTKIKSTGKGNKFARHHDGTILPGRGERNWDADLGLRAFPSEVAAEERQKRDSRREARSRKG